MCVCLECVRFFPGFFSVCVSKREFVRVCLECVCTVCVCGLEVETHRGRGGSGAERHRSGSCGRGGALCELWAGHREREKNAELRLSPG